MESEQRPKIKLVDKDRTHQLKCFSKLSAIKRLMASRADIKSTQQILIQKDLINSFLVISFGRQRCTKEKYDEQYLKHMEDSKMKELHQLINENQPISGINLIKMIPQCVVKSQDKVDQMQIGKETFNYIGPRQLQDRYYEYYFILQDYLQFRQQSEDIQRRKQQIKNLIHQGFLAMDIFKEEKDKQKKFGIIFQLAQDQHYSVLCIIEIQIQLTQHEIDKTLMQCFPNIKRKFNKQKEFRQEIITYKGNLVKQQRAAQKTNPLSRSQSLYDRNRANSMVSSKNLILSKKGQSQSIIGDGSKNSMIDNAVSISNIGSKLQQSKQSLQCLEIRGEPSATSSQNKRKEQRLNKLKLQNEQMQKEIIEKTQQKQELERKLTSVNQTVQKLQVEVENIQKEKRIVQFQISLLNASLKGHKNLKNQLQKQNKQWQETIEKLQTPLKNKQWKKNSIQQKINKVQKQIKEYDQKLQNLKKQSQKMKKAFEQQQLKLHQKSKKMVFTICDLQKQNKDRQNKIQQLEAQRFQYYRVSMRLSPEVKHLKQENDKLFNQIKKLQQEYKQQNTKLQKLQNDLQHAVQQQQYAKNRRIQSQQQTIIQRNTLSTLQNNLIHLKQQIQKKINEQNLLTSSLNLQYEQTIKLEQQFKLKRQSNLKILSKISSQRNDQKELQQQLNQLSLKHQNMRNEITKIQASIQTESKHIPRLMKDIKEIKDEKEKLIKQKNKLIDDYNRQHNEVQSISQQLSQKKQQKESLLKQIQNQDKHILKYQKDLQQKNKKKQQLQQQIKTQDQQIQKRNAQLYQKNLQTAQIKQQIQREDIYLQTLNKKLQKLKQKIQQQQQFILDQEKQLQESIEKYYKVQQHISIIQYQNNQLEWRVLSKLKSELRDTKKQIKQLQEEIGIRSGQKLNLKKELKHSRWITYILLFLMILSGFSFCFNGQSLSYQHDFNMDQNIVRQIQDISQSADPTIPNEMLKNYKSCLHMHSTEQCKIAVKETISPSEMKPSVRGKNQIEKETISTNPSRHSRQTYKQDRER